MSDIYDNDGRRDEFGGADDARTEQFQPSPQPSPQPRVQSQPDHYAPQDPTPLGRSGEAPPPPALSVATGGQLTPAPVAVPTTDEAGQVTAKPQAKVIAMISGSLGATVVTAVAAKVLGVQLDPEVAIGVAGVLASLIGSLLGYLKVNRSSAN